MLKKRVNSKIVAKYTVDVLEETVPNDVPGIAFFIRRAGGSRIY
jgi:Fructose-bisphosphate aldolase class-I.